MKTNLIDALIASPGGKAIREAFAPPAQLMEPEIVYVRLRHGSERSGECVMRIVLAKIGNDGCLSGEAADVDFRCTGVRELAWSFDWEYYNEKIDEPEHQSSKVECRLEIDTQDRFKIFCDQLEVIKVRPYRLSEEATIENGKR